MFMHFEFKDGANPYITTSNKTLFDMLTNFNCRQASETSFMVYERVTPPKTYTEKQEALREIAITWQNTFNCFDYDGHDLNKWFGFFYDYGKRYGLLKEFKANGII